MQTSERPPSDLSIAGTSYQRVRDRLRADILDGTLAPGTRIKVVQLANRYGMSQMPIREAIQQLQGEGLVIMVPNRGATVRVIDSQFIGQIFDIRAALEGALARRAAAVITDDEIERVGAVMRRHEREKGDDHAQIQNNIDFHRTINGIAGNDEALKILTQYTQIIVGLKRRFGIGPKTSERIKQVVVDHRALFEALTARDETAVQLIAEQHVRHARAEVLDWMSDQSHPKD